MNAKFEQFTHPNWKKDDTVLFPLSFLYCANHNCFPIVSLLIIVFRYWFLEHFVWFTDLSWTVCCSLSLKARSFEKFVWCPAERFLKFPAGYSSFSTKASCSTRVEMFRFVLLSLWQNKWGDFNQNSVNQVLAKKALLCETLVICHLNLLGLFWFVWNKL